MTPASDPTTREPVVPTVDTDRLETREEATAVRNPVEARQGESSGRIRWVLIIGVVATVLVFLIAYLAVAPG